PSTASRPRPAAARRWWGCLFTRGCARPTSCGSRKRRGRSAPGVAEHGDDRPQCDHEVTPQRPVLDVVVVEPGPVLDRGVTPETVHLRPTGHADGNPVALVVARDGGAEVVDVRRPLRPGP